MFMFLNGKSAGKENRNRKTIFDIHIRQIKKSVIYTLTSSFKIQRNGEPDQFIFAS